MANRHTLHFKHLEPFKSWLIKTGWEILPLSKSQHEVLRAKKDCEWILVYQKDEAKEHYSLSDNSSKWVNRWIAEKRIRTDERKATVEEIRKLAKEYTNKDFKLCNHEYANGYCYGLQYDLAKILVQVEKENRDEINND